MNNKDNNDDNAGEGKILKAQVIGRWSLMLQAIVNGFRFFLNKEM